jgi:hypothetical protein
VFGVTPPPAHLGGQELFPKHQAGMAFKMEMPEGYDPPIESGQLLVDKGRCWRALRLALLICEYSDLTFRYFHGDKETFRFAWRLLGQRYHLPRRFPGWDTHTILQHCPENKDDVLFLHRTQDKLKLRAEGNRRGSAIPDEEELFRYAKELDIVWGGRPWWNARTTPTEELIRQKLTGMTEYRRGDDKRSLELKADGSIGAGADRLERWWSAFEDDGKPTLVITGDEGLTATATCDEDGVWRGRWIVYERNAIEIEPLPRPDAAPMTEAELASIARANGSPLPKRIAMATPDATPELAV